MKREPKAAEAYANPLTLRTIKRVRLSYESVALCERSEAYGAARKLLVSHDAAHILTKLIGSEVTEVIVALMLDSKNKVIGYAECARGGVSSVACTPNDVLRPLVLSGCERFILAHNHPSGDTTPSAEDILFTTRIRSGARLLGCTLIDHVIVARDSAHFSMLDAGLLNEVKS